MKITLHRTPSKRHHYYATGRLIPLMWRYGIVDGWKKYWGKP